MKKTLNLTELAEYVSIHKRTLHRMIAENRFPVPHLKGTKPRIWSTEQVDAWLRGEEIDR